MQGRALGGCPAALIQTTADWDLYPSCQVVERLVELGADMHLVDNEGRTALHLGTQRLCCIVPFSGCRQVCCRPCLHLQNGKLRT